MLGRRCRCARRGQRRPYSVPAHIRRRTDRHARAGERVVGRRNSERERDAEIRHERVTVVKEDVRGLHVAVDDAAAVGVVERSCDFAGEADRLRNGEPPVALESLLQGLTFDERHSIVGKA